eukprot:GHVH01013158.1.p1 GENE.GHVH01013158.1~~GHVH01013158.1.p1  ORF type:complete len:391 (+),score=49.94 GHVH01013158.1:486-1658(+)
MIHVNDNIDPSRNIDVPCIAIVFGRESVNIAVREEESVDHVEITIPTVDLRSQGATDMVNTIVKRVSPIVNKDSKWRIVVGFPVPLEYPSRTLSTAYLTRHPQMQSKDLDDPLLGTDLVKLFDKAFKSCGFQNAQVVSVCNTMVLKSTYFHLTTSPEDSYPILCLTAGHGLNACILVPQKCTELGYSGSFLNLELGNYSNSQFPVTPFDREVDVRSSEPGHYQLEKMTSISGLAWIAKRMIINVLGHRRLRSLWKLKPGVLRLMECAGTDGGLIQLIHEVYGVKMTEDEEASLKRCLVAVFNRAIRVVAYLTDELISVTIGLSAVPNNVNFRVMIYGDYNEVSWYPSTFTNDLKTIMQSKKREYKNSIELQFETKGEVLKGALLMSRMAA